MAKRQQFTDDTLRALGRVEGLRDDRAQGDSVLSLKAQFTMIPRPYIISINSVSGGGKTALSNALRDVLPNAALFGFDDFSATNVVADDLYAWSRRGADPLEIDVLRQLRAKRGGDGIS